MVLMKLKAKTGDAPVFAFSLEVYGLTFPSIMRFGGPSQAPLRSRLK